MVKGFCYFNREWASFSFRYFDSVDVCKIRDEWAEARVNGCFPAFAGPPAKVALVSVFSTTEVDLCLFQEGVRCGLCHVCSLLSMLFGSSVLLCSTL